MSLILVMSPFTYGNPEFVQDQTILSNREIEIARKCILFLRRRIRGLCIVRYDFDGLGYKHSNPVWVQ
jgi:hypothetical protein